MISVLIKKVEELNSDVLRLDSEESENSTCTVSAERGHQMISDRYVNGITGMSRAPEIRLL